MKPVAENGACDTGTPTCSRDLECYQGTCTKHVDPNGACVLGETERTCDTKQGYACTASTCTAMTFNTAGGSCAYPLRCSASACISNSCTAYTADGAACTSAEGGSNCQAPAFCNAGKCAQFDPGSCK